MRKNLVGVLKEDFQQFVSRFKSCQLQPSKLVFHTMYNALLEDFPKAQQYMAQHLTPSVHHWATCYHDVFTGGTMSTQRGKGLNRHIKQHLSQNASLMKLLRETAQRCLHEDARLVITEAKQQVHNVESEHVINKFFFICLKRWVEYVYPCCVL